VFELFRARTLEELENDHQIGGRSHLGALASAFHESLPFLPNTASIRTFGEQEDGVGGAAEQVVGDAAMPPWDAARNALGDRGHLERNAIGVEPLMRKATRGLVETVGRIASVIGRKSATCRRLAFGRLGCHQPHRLSATPFVVAGHEALLQDELFRSAEIATATGPSTRASLSTPRAYTLSQQRMQHSSTMAV
jgi:hypothetical protein